MLKIAIAFASITILVGAVGGQLTSPNTALGGAEAGDVNCDGQSNPLDAALILQFSAGLITSLPCEEAADTNGDTFINALDSALVLQFSAGLIDHLGPAQPTATRTPTTAPSTSTAIPSTNTPVPPPATSLPTTPPPTATSSPSGELTTRNSTWSQDQVFGDIEVVGEVVNGRNEDVALVEVTANAYSASDTLLSTASSFACMSTLAPGADSPFDIFFYEPPDGIDHIAVAVTDFSEPPFIFSDPPVVGMDTDVTNVFTDSTNFRHVVGTATNNSSSTYEFINVCSAHYDNAGNVVRTGFDFLRPDALAPGQSGKFSMVVDSLGVGIVSDRIWIDAGYAEDPVPPFGSITIQHSTWYEEDFLGDIEVVGEVVNNTGDDVALVEVTANVYSASNTLLTVESGYACVTSMAPGTDSPFTISIFEAPENFDHIDLHVTHISQPPFLLADPPVLGLDTTTTNHFVDDIDFKHVVGTVTNNSTNTYDFVNVCAAFYDGSGYVVRTGLDFATPETLGPGEMASFEVLVDALGADIESERLWVDALYD